MRAISITLDLLFRLKVFKIMNKSKDTRHKY